MKPTTLRIQITGYAGTDWPKARIYFNREVLLDGQIKDTVVIEKNVVLEHHNHIVITHYDKNNDTQIDSEGNIIRDRYCMIDGIWINGMLFDLDFFSENNIYFTTLTGEKLITAYLGVDGTFDSDFPGPLWKFWRSTQ